MKIKIRKYELTLTQILSLSIYYSFAFYLPDSNGVIKWGANVRRLLCRHIFKKCGKNIMVHRKANFGIGINVEIGDYSDIGVNAVIPSDTIIGKNVLMAPNCYIFSVNHRFDDVSKPIKSQGVTKKNRRLLKMMCGLDAMLQ